MDGALFPLHQAGSSPPDLKFFTEADSLRQRIALRKNTVTGFSFLDDNNWKYLYFFGIGQKLSTEKRPMVKIKESL